MKKNKPNEKYKSIILLSTILLIIVTLLSAKYGAVVITTDEIFSSIQKWFNSNNNFTLNERIFLDIRLPRAFLSLFVGASLAVGGVLMQSLFRNPIIEPGLIGTSSGAAFGAALYFVLGALMQFNTGEWTLPLAACSGAVISTLLVFTLSQTKQNNKSSIVLLLLIGIAVNALFLSGVGFLSYIARDPQARSITFWSLGTLSGANWNSVIIVGISTVCCIFWALTEAKNLNALMMGEDEAQLIGVNVKQLKFKIIIINVILIAVATSFTGIISFVGLIVPHLLRTSKSSNNKFLITTGALIGGVVLSVSDLAARLLLSPAELPIGIVTSFVGVPIFIFLLRKKEFIF